ncbi:BadF/BadG/BcrA/BcrD ATPase family protein [Halobacillus sp. Marseille-P3879]|uniref:BadF/BadG/BcrA/BcrD ATPase family protein n=1 Tax=Halobacillus sp. Marseille-P3879 TaxID=2045014 RepID=UPI000C7BEEDD|nr:BadF/BadG/BcrA/BcrD ATPase family protein [Halobacillus sp. Marseille-P3879]
MIVGIDAGGTSTKGALISKAGEIIATFQSGFGNPLIHEEKAIKHVNDVFKACIQAADQPVEHVVIGMAGYSTAGARLRVPEHWKNYNLTIVNDAELALEAAIPKGDGILTVAGTGSIHIGKKNQINYTSGGWGHLLGDEGGGYDIGRRAVRIALTSLESNQPLNSFSRSLLLHIDSGSTDEVKSWFYSQDKFEIARLAEFVSELADNNDAAALQILESSIKTLTGQIRALYQRMELDTKANLVLAGSVLLKNEYCYSLISKEMRGLFKKINRMSEPAYIGAYFIADSK